MKAIAAKQPDILIVDISLNGPDGLDLLKNLRTLYPDLPVLILSMHDESIYAERALRARANGYIMKQEATEKVLVAVRRILGGDIYLSDRMANKLLHQYMSGSFGRHEFPPLCSFRSRAGGLPPDRRRPQHAPDRRETASQHKDSRILPGPHQREAVAAQRPRTGATRHPIDHQRKNLLIAARILPGNFSAVAAKRIAAAFERHARRCLSGNLLCQLK